MGFISRLESLMKGMSKADFARKVGVHVSTIALWTDDKLPKGDTLRNISEELGVSLDWLLTGQGDPYIKAPGKSSILVEESGEPFKGRIREAEEHEGDDQASLARIIEMLMKIVGTGNKTLNRAIFSGLEAFAESVNQKTHLAALEAKIHDLTESVHRVQQENKTLRTELNRMKAIYENPGAAPNDEEEQAV